MSLGYKAGVGMGANAHEELSIKNHGEGRDYLLRLQEERLQAEKPARQGKLIQGGIMIKFANGWQTFHSEWLSSEADVESWQMAMKLKHGEKSPIGFLNPEFVLIANKYKEPEETQALNLTQHQASAEQVAAGVVESAEKSAVQAVLTFDAIPSIEEIQQRALLLAAIAAQSGCKKAMIGGAPFFMSALESALKAQGIAPVYAFSQRESVETVKDDGSVVKSAVFRHVGFVEADVILGMPESQKD